MSDDPIKLLCENLTRTLSTLQQSTAQVCTFAPYNEAEETFEIDLQRFENYITILDLKREEAETKKTQIFLNTIMVKMFQLLTNLTTPALPKTKTYNELVELLKNHLHPKPNAVVEQNRFVLRIQKEDESIVEYVAELQKLSKTCMFECPHCKKSIAETHLVTQFIRGVHDRDIRERLLQESELDFKKAVIIATSIENAKRESGTLRKAQARPPNSDSEVLKIHTQQKKTSNNERYTGNDFKYRTYANKPQRKPGNNFQKQRYKRRGIGLLKALGIENMCLRCGKSNHRTNDCRLDRNNLGCKSCGKKGHTAKVCIKTLKNEQNKNTNYISQVSSDVSSDYEDDQELFTVNCDKISDSSDGDAVMVNIRINGKHIYKFECDSGCKLTLISLNDFKKLCPGIKLATSHARF